jgi:hypothetical protein
MRLQFERIGADFQLVVVVHVGGSSDMALLLVVVVVLVVCSGNFWLGIFGAGTSRLPRTAKRDRGPEIQWKLRQPTTKPYNIPLQGN